MVWGLGVDDLKQTYGVPKDALNTLWFQKGAKNMRHVNKGMETNFKSKIPRDPKDVSNLILK